MSIARHQYEVYIRATPEEVFGALTDPAFTRQYFHGTTWDRPPVQGEAYSTTTTDGRPAVDGVVEVHEPPHRLVLTWHTLYDAAMAAEPVSRVEWQVDAAGEGLTRLRLVHGDLAQSPLTWDSVRHGWVWVLDGLKTLLETGTPLPAVGEDPPRTEDVAGDWHRQQGVEANNSTWELIDLPVRTPDQTEEMLRRAYAAAYHWDRAAGRQPANAARGDWLLAKVHLLAGRPGDLAAPRVALPGCVHRARARRLRPRLRPRGRRAGPQGARPGRGGGRGVGGGEGSPGRRRGGPGDPGEGPGRGAVERFVDLVSHQGCWGA